MRRVGFPDAFRCVASVQIFADPTEAIPTKWLPRGRWRGQGVALHTFCDDYRQEFFWRRPFDGLVVATAAGVCTAPDFTVWTDDPEEWARYQCWRSALVGAFWQSHGVRVLPVVAFRGEPWRFVPRGSVWALRGPSALVPAGVWLADLELFCEMARPALLVVFGNALPHSFSGCAVVRRSLFSRMGPAAQKEGR